MIFLRILPKIFLWSHYSGARGAQGPRFIEPPERPVPMPLRNSMTPLTVGLLRSQETEQSFTGFCTVVESSF